MAFFPPGYIAIDGWAFGVLSYFLAHALHVVIWHRREIRRDVRALFLLFIVAPLSLYAAAGLGRSGTALLAPALVHFALSANYIAVYPAIQARSPSLKILSLLSQSPAPQTASDLVAALGDNGLIRERVQDLQTGKLIRRENGVVRLSRLGNAVAIFFQLFRRALGLRPGEG